MKIIKVISVAVFAAFTTPSFAGGKPVIDRVSIQNARFHFKEKIAHMVKELQEAKRLYDSVNGATTMDQAVAALNNPKVRELLGPEFMRTASDPTAPLENLGELAGHAQALVNFTKVTPQQLSAEDFYRSELDRLGLSAGRNGAVGQRIIHSSDERLAGLEQLRIQLGKVETQKEVDALRARIQIEIAMLQNDMNRIQGLAMVQHAQAQLNDQRARETLLLKWQQNETFWEGQSK